MQTFGMQILTNVASVLIGGLITWWVAKRYYKKASMDLEKEAKELRHLINYMLLGMEEMGWVKLNRDAQGNIKGYVYTIKPQSGVIDMKGSVTPSVKTSHDKEH